LAFSAPGHGMGPVAPIWVFLAAGRFAAEALLKRVGFLGFRGDRERPTTRNMAGLWQTPFRAIRAYLLRFILSLLVHAHEYFS
jgi:hypothetical protein